MILNRITINNFGAIYNRTMEFAPGLNLICAEEEREILSDFIKIMFFLSLIHISEPKRHCVMWFRPVWKWL